MDPAPTVPLPICRKGSLIPTHGSGRFDRLQA